MFNNDLKIKGTNGNVIHKQDTFVETWKRRKHQEFISPLRQHITLAESMGCKYSGTLESIEALQNPRKGLGGELQLIMVSFNLSTITVTYTLSLSLMACSSVYDPGVTYTVGRKQYRQKEHCPQILGTCAKITDCCFQPQKNKSGRLLTFPPLLHSSCLARVTSRGLKRAAPTFPSSFIFVLLWEPNIKD